MPSRPLIERFNEKFERRADGCWIWTASLGTGGYGQIYSGADSGRPTMLGAHRVAYEIHVGPIPRGKDLDHLCRVRACVNPAHLEPVTRGENVLRGEGLPAQRARQTHCANSHELTKANLLPRRDGRRRCRVCHDEWRTKWEHENLAKRAAQARARRMKKRGGPQPAPLMR